MQTLLANQMMNSTLNGKLFQNVLGAGASTPERQSSDADHMMTSTLNSTTAKGKRAKFGMRNAKTIDVAGIFTNMLGGGKPSAVSQPQSPEMRAKRRQTVGVPSPSKKLDPVME